MLSFQMLSAEKLREFFERHGIPLAGTKRLSNIDPLIWDGEQLGGESLLRFLVATIFNEELSVLTTNFDSYEELEDAYTNFLMGYNQTKTTPS